MSERHGAYIYILVIKAENLLAADSNGFSDCFCDVYMDANTRRVKSTKVINKTLNPNWNHRISFHRPRHDATSTATFTVFDADWLGRDFLGSATVEVGKAPFGVVQDVCVELGPMDGKSRGKLYLKISSGDSRETPDLNVYGSLSKSSFQS
ncbi:hypothetical protein CYMTET_27693 [Cymbomonas tetramitiformis]|uniref:C2 domain-containing protein n=1 Tax=Cymbomonas tetramitiformis TaxID=36881 RepID=A0AAE0FPP9_9CHLO|nr:hypothetical protein CYMTET_27693 [Cymbomonas tetramitiformis]